MPRLNRECFLEVLKYARDNIVLEDKRPTKPQEAKTKPINISNIVESLEYENEDIYYAIKMARDEGYIVIDPKSSSLSDYKISDLTMKGHEYIDSHDSE